MLSHAHHRCRTLADRERRGPRVLGPDAESRRPTAPARAALDRKFMEQAEGDPVRAAHLRKAHFKRLALKSAQARRKARELTEAADAAEAELAGAGGPDAA